MNAEHAREVIDAFTYENPHCNSAVADDQAEVGFEWRFEDGRMLYVDICADGTVVAAWSPIKTAK